MKSSSSLSFRSLMLRSAVALAAVAACSGASALSAFTFDPGIAPTVIADTFTVNDYAVVTGAADGSFTETGYLAISSFNLNGTVAASPGLNTTYGLYISFDAAGANGLLTLLDYSVYEYSGSAATFTADASGVTKSATTGDTLLATGSLVPSAGNTYSANLPYSATLTANSLSFSAATTAFSPISGAVGSFTNSGNQLGVTTTGFYVSAGGGTINLIPSAVPEPETYALMLGGLAAIGFVARRRTHG